MHRTRRGRADCGREDDLTCHLDPGFAGDHREATLDDVITLC
jgi:hypothetical protein